MFIYIYKICLVLIFVLKYCILVFEKRELFFIFLFLLAANIARKAQLRLLLFFFLKKKLLKTENF
jgi:hypothetical protein